MTGMLDQTFKETYQGTAEVRETFKVPKFGTIAGCYISDGKVARGSGKTAARQRRHLRRQDWVSDVLKMMPRKCGRV
jgi:translation initiation factor IF-2